MPTFTYSIAEVIEGVPYSATHQIDRLQLSTLLTEIAGYVETLGLALGSLDAGDFLQVATDGSIQGAQVILDQQVSGFNDDYTGSLVLFDGGTTATNSPDSAAGWLAQQLYASAGGEEGARAQIAVSYDTDVLAWRTSADGTIWTDWGILARRAMDHTPIVAAAGTYRLTAFAAGSLTTQIGVANQVDLYGWVCPQDMTADRLAIECTTGVAAATARIVIYDSDANGRPAARLHQSASAHDVSTTGVKEETVSLTFQRGHFYWVGVHHSSTATLRAYPAGAGAPDIPGPVAANTYKTFSRASVTFASGAPNPWTFNSAEASTRLPACIWMRAA